MAETNNNNKNTEKKLEGVLHTVTPLTVVQKKKNDMDSGDYWYNVGLSNGTDLLVCTAGKKADDLEPFKSYIFGFDYLDKKLKLVDFRPVD